MPSIVGTPPMVVRPHPAPFGTDRAFARICGYGAFPRMGQNPPRKGGGERMDFGKRVMARAWPARVGAFFAPRRSRVVNPGEEVGLRNPSFSHRRRGASRHPRIAGSAGATRARRPRHNEKQSRFRQNKMNSQLISSFIRLDRDPFEGGKRSIKSLKTKRLYEKEAPGEGVSRGRGICPHLPAFALLGRAAIP